MAARYYVLVSQELLVSSPDWAAAGLTLVEQCPRSPSEPEMRWCVFDDPGAAPELDGKRVEVQIVRQDGRPVITGRVVLA